MTNEDFLRLFVETTDTFSSEAESYGISEEGPKKDTPENSALWARHDAFDDVSHPLVMWFDHVKEGGEPSEYAFGVMKSLLQVDIVPEIGDIKLIELIRHGVIRRMNSGPTPANNLERAANLAYRQACDEMRTILTLWLSDAPNLAIKFINTLKAKYADLKQFAFLVPE